MRVSNELNEKSAPLMVGTFASFCVNLVRAPIPDSALIPHHNPRQREREIRIRHGFRISRHSAR